MQSLPELSLEDAKVLFCGCFPVLANRLGRSTTALIVENALSGESEVSEPSAPSDDEHQSAYFETVKSALQMASAIIAIYNFIKLNKNPKALTDEKELVQPVRSVISLPEKITDAEIAVIIRESLKLSR